MDPEAFKHVDVGLDENGVLIYSKDGGRTAKRVVSETPEGGSLPDDSGKSVGDLLRLIAVTVGGILSPTIPQLDTDARVQKVLQEGWASFTAYQNIRASEGGVGEFSDITQFLHPEGSDNIFVTEANGSNTTGDTEPTWTDALNLGDTLSDGDYTWTNAGLYADWPFAPTTWQANHAYDIGSFVWPTTPNGHVYVALIGPLTSDSAEPVFPTNGDYVADNDGYWWDAGTPVEFAAAWQALGGDAIFDRVNINGVGVSNDRLAIHQTDQDDYAWQIYNDAFNRILALLGIYADDAGTLFALADSPFQIKLDPWLQIIATGAGAVSGEGDPELTLDFQNVPVTLAGLPTSEPADPGLLYIDAGVLKVSLP